MCALRARLGRPLSCADLDADRPGGRGAAPSRTALIEQLGGWRRICAILGQPYLTGRSVTSGAWANQGYAYRTLPAAYRATLRTTASTEDGYRTQLAPGVVPGVDQDPVVSGKDCIVMQAGGTRTRGGGSGEAGEQTMWADRQGTCCARIAPVSAHRMGSGCSTTATTGYDPTRGASRRLTS